MKTRNSEVLASFVAYCGKHPDLRFWQALRSWACVFSVLVLRDTGYQTTDTFHWEGRDR